MSRITFLVDVPRESPAGTRTPDQHDIRRPAREIFQLDIAFEESEAGSCDESLSSIRQSDVSRHGKAEKRFRLGIEERDTSALIHEDLGVGQSHRWL